MTTPCLTLYSLIWETVSAGAWWVNSRGRGSFLRSFSGCFWTSTKSTRITVDEAGSEVVGILRNKTASKLEAMARSPLWQELQMMLALWSLHGGSAGNGPSAAEQSALTNLLTRVAICWASLEMLLKLLAKQMAAALAQDSDLKVVWDSSLDRAEKELAAQALEDALAGRDPAGK